MHAHAAKYTCTKTGKQCERFGPLFGRTGCSGVSFSFELPDFVWADLGCQNFRMSLEKSLRMIPHESIWQSPPISTHKKTHFCGLAWPGETEIEIKTEIDKQLGPQRRGSSVLHICSTHMVSLIHTCQREKQFMQICSYGSTLCHARSVMGLVCIWS